MHPGKIVGQAVVVPGDPSAHGVMALSRERLEVAGAPESGALSCWRP